MEEYISLEKAQKYLDDSEKIMKNVHAFFNKDEFVLGVPEFSNWLITQE